MAKLTQKEASEYIRCRQDPIYFLKTYGKIRHPTKGLLSFDLWDFQEDCVKDFINNSYNIVLKARQLGLSTLCAGYCGWLMTFFKDKEIYILATKRDTATNLVDKVKVILTNMPEWMQHKFTIENRQSLKLSNGSIVKASGTTKDAARSESLSLLIIDEAAFVEKLDDIWIAAQPTLSTGGDCIALSTPNGMGNWFHKMYSEAETGVSVTIAGQKKTFNPIKLHWSNHPDRNVIWADNERAKIGPQAFAQEHDADFLQSGNQVVDINDLAWYERNPSNGSLSQELPNSPGKKTISDNFDEDINTNEIASAEKNSGRKNSSAEKNSGSSLTPAIRRSQDSVLDPITMAQRALGIEEPVESRPAEEPGRNEVLDVSRFDTDGRDKFLNIAPSQPYAREPLEKSGFDRGFWIWEYPQPGASYLISADVARGDGNDYSAAQIFDTVKYEQVGEYKGKLPTDLFARLLIQIAVQYNDAKLVIENNGVGHATIQEVINSNYQNLYWTDRTKQFVDVSRGSQNVDFYDKTRRGLKPGFATTARTRPLIIARMEEDIRNHDIILHSKRLLAEFQTFIYVKGKPMAMEGYHDDMVMALAIGMYVRNTDMMLFQQGGEVSRTLLGNVSYGSTPWEYGVISSQKKEGDTHESYKLATGRGHEDMRWLI